MEIWIRDQINAIMAALVMGVAFGMIYDVIRIIHVLTGVGRYSGFKNEKRSLGKRRISGSILIFLLDVIFCILFTVCFAVLSYAFCDGRFRMFVLISTIAGFAAYILTVGRAVMYFSEVIVYYLKLAAGYVVRAVMFPVKLFSRALKKLLLFVYNHTLALFIKKIVFMKQLRYTKKIKCKLSEAVRFDI